jgi:hypothetical protein
MKNRNTRLFELLVVGGGLWIVTGCGAATDPSTQNVGTQAAVQRTSADGGVVDGGSDTLPVGGHGSEFW